MFTQCSITVKTKNMNTENEIIPTTHQPRRPRCGLLPSQPLHASPEEEADGGQGDSLLLEESLLLVGEPEEGTPLRPSYVSTGVFLETPNNMSEDPPAVLVGDTTPTSTIYGTTPRRSSGRKSTRSTPLQQTFVPTPGMAPATVNAKRMKISPVTTITQEERDTWTRDMCTFFKFIDQRPLNVGVSEK